MDKYEHIMVIWKILGQIKDDKELTSRIIQAAITYSNIVCCETLRAGPIPNIWGVYKMAARIKTLQNFNCPFLDDATWHLVVDDANESAAFRYGNKWFRAKLSPARFEQGKLARLTVVDWNASTYVPEISWLEIERDINMPLPRGLKCLRIEYQHLASCDIPATLNELGIFNMADCVTWWPGVNYISNQSSDGTPCENPQKNVIKIPAGELYDRLIEEPQLQKDLKGVTVKVGKCEVTIRANSPGDIVPFISYKSIDLRKLTNKTITYFSAEGFNGTLYLPSDHMLEKLVVSGTSDIKCDGVMPHLKYLDINCSDGWFLVKDYVPNVKVLSLRCYVGDCIESNSLEVLIIRNHSVMPQLRCPNLRKIIDFSNVFNARRGWVRVDSYPSTYIRSRAMRYDPSPYRLEGSTYHVKNEDDFRAQYRKFNVAGLIIEENI